MPQIPRHIVDQVRDRTDIAEVIGRHVRLERAGNSFKGLCPFHQERSPSFNVIPSKGIYYCFGCQSGGDVFKFLMTVEGLSFVEAVKELAAPAGIEVPERDLTADEKRALQQRATLFDVLEAACAFYESTLWTRPEGQRGREYLEKRKLSPELSRKARVGYAPAGWTPLIDRLVQQGFPEAMIAEVGLSRPRKSGDGVYDLFRERVLFPIRDERARVIGFGGRLLEGDGPKYVNTPETRLYQKSHVLYGLEMARQAIQQRDRVVVVEGYFDVLAMHDAGFAETVATCGTALTPEHLKKLQRLTKHVIVLLDADEAGSRAAAKVLPMFLEAGLTPWRLQLPGAKDPDELVRTEGPEAMQRALEQKQPLLEWYIDRRVTTLGANGLSRQQILGELAPYLADLPQVWTSVAARLHLAEGEVFATIRAAAPAAEPEPFEGPSTLRLLPPVPSWRPTKDVTHLVWLLVHRYGKVADLVARSEPSLLDAHVPLRDVVARLITGEPVAAIIADTADPEIARLLQAVTARTELYTEEQAPLGMCEVLDRLESPQRDARIAALARHQEDALRANDMAAQRVAGAERAALVSLKKALVSALRAGKVDAWIAARAAAGAQTRRS